MSDAPATPAICPHCGYSLARDAAVALGQLTIDPRGTAAWAGRPLPLQRAQHALLFALVEASPRAAGRPALLARIAVSDATDPKALDVQVCKLRAALAAAGATGVGIVTVWGAGYRLEVMP